MDLSVLQKGAFVSHHTKGVAIDKMIVNPVNLALPGFSRCMRDGKGDTRDQSHRLFHDGRLACAGGRGNYKKTSSVHRDGPSS